MKLISQNMGGEVGNQIGRHMVIIQDRIEMGYNEWEGMGKDGWIAWEEMGEDGYKWVESHRATWEKIGCI
jgi:hypothetical protein